MAASCWSRNPTRSSDELANCPTSRPAPWFRTLTDLFRAPNIVTATSVGLTVVEAVHELAEAVRELTAVVRKVNGLGQDDP